MVSVNGSSLLKLFISIFPLPVILAFSVNTVISSIIIFAFEILLIGVFIFLAYKNKVVFSKSNILYFVPLVIIVTALNLIGQIYLNNSFDFFMLSDSLKFAFKVFAFETNKTFVALAISDCPLFAISYYIAILLGGLTLVSSVLGLIKTTLINMIRVNKTKLLKADIVVGSNENAISYATHNKNSILWVDLNTIDLLKNECGQIGVAVIESIS